MHIKIIKRENSLLYLPTYLYLQCSSFLLQMGRGRPEFPFEIISLSHNIFGAFSWNRSAGNTLLVSFYLNNFILPSFLKDIFTDYRTLGSNSIFLQHLNLLFPIVSSTFILIKSRYSSELLLLCI